MVIELQARLIFGTAAVALLGIILYLVHKGLIKEKHTLLWIPLGVGFFIIGMFPGLLVWFSKTAHLHYTTVVLLFVIVVYTNILIYLTIKLSQMKGDIQALAKDQVLIKNKLKDGSARRQTASSRKPR